MRYSSGNSAQIRPIPATTSHSNPQPKAGSACSDNLGVTGHKSGHKCLERTTGQLLNVLRQKLRPDRHEISFLFTVLAAVGSADSIEDESNCVKVRFIKDSLWQIGRTAPEEVWRRRCAPGQSFLGGLLGQELRGEVQ